MFTAVLICSTFFAFVVAPCAIGLHIRATFQHPAARMPQDKS